MPRTPSSQPSARVRPLIASLHAYTPGEQPRIPGLIKLNTNENPYPPAPAVLRAIRQAVNGGLRLYPDPAASDLRRRLAQHHGCHPANVIVGNGSDELLALATRAFVEPTTAVPRSQRARATVQCFDPSYSLYPILAAMHGASLQRIPLQPDFSLPNPRTFARAGTCDPNAALTFITTPNAPSGHGYSSDDLRRLCRRLHGVVVLDEAYADFAAENALGLAFEFPHVLVARTFSKAYSLCALRIGYMLGHPELIGALDRIRDSYNVNGLGQVAACATLDHLGYYRRRHRQVLRQRGRLTRELSRLGFRCLPSSTNFVLVQPPGRTAREWLDALRHHRILVRWFDHPAVRQFLRITVGDAGQMQALVKTVRRLLE